MFKTLAVFSLRFFIATAVQAQYTADSSINKKISFAQMPAKPSYLLPAALPANFSVQQLPFFCDKEYKLEKATKIPFRFRLGSVAYCDKMEGKN